MRNAIKKRKIHEDKAKAYEKWLKEV